MRPPPPPQTLYSNDDEKHSLLLMQRELGKALHESVGAVTQERLPERMVLLLGRLALAQGSRRERQDESADNRMVAVRRR